MTDSFVRESNVFDMMLTSLLDEAYSICEQEQHIGEHIFHPKMIELYNLISTISKQRTILYHILELNYSLWIFDRLELLLQYDKEMFVYFEGTEFDRHSIMYFQNKLLSCTQDDRLAIIIRTLHNQIQDLQNHISRLTAKQSEMKKEIQILQKYKEMYRKERLALNYH